MRNLSVPLRTARPEPLRSGFEPTARSADHALLSSPAQALDDGGVEARANGGAHAQGLAAAQRLLDDSAGVRTLQRQAQALSARSPASTSAAASQAAAPIQRRPVFFQFRDGAMSIDTEKVPREKLEWQLQNPDLATESKMALMEAIDAGETAEGYATEYDLARKHLGFFKENLPPFGEENEHTWVKRITGGGSRSLTGKRKEGKIKTDMGKDEYDATEELTTGFYDSAKTLNDVAPREKALTLYRGFTIPRIKGDDPEGQLAEKIGGYSDVLPSSASWQRAPSIGMSQPGENEDAVLVYMKIPPSLAVVMTSYPDNQSGGDRPKNLDIGQAEVLVGASTNKNVEVLRTEQLKNGSRRFHVQVELDPMDPGEVIDGIRKARKESGVDDVMDEEMDEVDQKEQSGKTFDLDEDQLAGVLGEDAAKYLIENKPEGQEFVTLDTRRIRFLFGDSRFGYTFEPVG